MSWTTISDCEILVAGALLWFACMAILDGLLAARSGACLLWLSYIYAAICQCFYTHEENMVDGDNNLVKRHHIRPNKTMSPSVFG
jgi:hypothetical protein